MWSKKNAEIQIVNITNITNITTLPILSITLTLPNHHYYPDMKEIRAIFDVIVQISNITTLLLLECARIKPLLGRFLGLSDTPPGGLKAPSRFSSDKPSANKLRFAFRIFFLGAY